MLTPTTTMTTTTITDRRVTGNSTAYSCAKNEITNPREQLHSTAAAVQVFTFENFQYNP